MHSVTGGAERADVVRKYTRESSGRKTAVCASAELFWLCVYRLRNKSFVQQISLELKTVEKRLGGCVKKARPYYEARSKYRLALNAAQRATESFEHAVSPFVLLQRPTFRPHKWHYTSTVQGRHFFVWPR